MLEIFKIIRGYGGSAVCATQDLNDFFALEDGKYGKGIINNSKTKVILNLEDEEAQRVGSILHLSEAELMEITHFERGSALISTNNNNVAVEIKCSELEKELGVKLFEKENRKISLTAYGEQFLPYVQRSLALLDEGAAVLEQMAGNLPQVAKLGYFHSISASLIPALVEGFYREEDNRSIRFQFTEGPSFDIFNQLKAGELDMAFGMHRDDWAESVIIMRQPLYLAVPSDHPLAARHSVTFDDFAREPQVMLDKPSSLRTQMDRIFAQRGAVPNVVFEVRECNAALQYVALKFGVSVLPQVPAMDTEKVLFQI